MIPRMWLATTAVVAFVAVLAVIGGHWRRGATVYCAMDGATIAPATCVIVEMNGVQINGGRPLEFCSLACAERYLAASRSKPWRILLVDESTGEFAGQRIDAAEAHFARSQIADAANKDRRHVFARVEDAAAHAEAFRGRLLSGNEAPFADYRADYRAAKRVTRPPRGPLSHRASERPLEEPSETESHSPAAPSAQAAP